jgi:hypothetical protein
MDDRRRLDERQAKMKPLTPIQINGYIAAGFLKPFAASADQRCTDCGISKLFGLLDRELPSIMHGVCVVHDHLYWLGDWSGFTRLQADEEFRDAIVRSGHPDIATAYFIAVRAGGSGWIPTSWRWGFGWIQEPK